MGYTLSLLLLIAAVSFGLEIDVIHKWKYADYEWESQEQKEKAINSGTYDPYKCVFEDASKAQDGRIFITTSNVFGPGSPASLATVTNKTGLGGPLLRPYPNWSWYNRSCMCDGIVNVYRTNIVCNHLFVLDSGKIGLNHVCDPKLLIFDLKDDTLVKTIDIPHDFATNQTGSGLLTTPVVYIPGECTSQFLNKMIIFFSDTSGSGLIIYDSFTKRMCRIESDDIKPTETTFSVKNQQYIYEGGIFGMTIHHDELYYAALSGKEIYKIKIKTLLECPNKEDTNKQSKLVKNLSSQTGVIASAGCSIFYSDFEAMNIIGMNVCEESNNNTVILAQDDEVFGAISSMKVSSYWNKLTGLSDNFQHFILNTLNLNETNSHYFELKLSEIQKKMN